MLISAGSGGQDTEVEDGFRVDHILVDQASRGYGSCSVGAVADVYTFTYGVFDNWEVYLTSGAVIPSYPGYNSDSRGLVSWTEDAGWGGKKFVFLEDSHIEKTNDTDCWQGIGHFDGAAGGKLVIRHCTLINVNWGNHDLYGLDQRHHSYRAKEIYSNTWQWTNYPCGMNWAAGSSTRGGNYLFYDNNFAAHAVGNSGAITISYYNASGGTWDPCDDTVEYFCVGPNLPAPFLSAPPYNCTQDSDCGSGNYCVQVDAQERAGGGLCREQSGSGKTNLTTGVQDLEASYEWDNWVCIDGNGGICDPEIDGNEVDWAKSSPDLTFDLDIFNDTEAPNYTAYTYPHPLRSETSPSVQSGSGAGSISSSSGGGSVTAQ